MLKIMHLYALLAVGLVALKSSPSQAIALDAACLNELFAEREFAVERKLGEGTNAQVFRVRDSQGQVFAIKVYKDPKKRDRDFLFLRKYREATQRDPRGFKVPELENLGDNAMKISYVKGEDLHSLLSSDRPSAREKSRLLKLFDQRTLSLLDGLHESGHEVARLSARKQYRYNFIDAVNDGSTVYRFYMDGKEVIIKTDNVLVDAEDPDRSMTIIDPR